MDTHISWYMNDLVLLSNRIRYLGSSSVPAEVLVVLLGFSLIGSGTRFFGHPFRFNDFYAHSEIGVMLCCLVESPLQTYDSLNSSDPAHS